MSAASLTFEPVAHEYRRPDGRVVPSVTQILRDTGVSVDFDGIAAISARLGDAIELKREVGKALHADAHAFDDGDIDWETVDERVLPYLEAWRTFRENKRLSPQLRERRVYHPALGYCGTLDGVFGTPGLKRVLIDIKLGDPEDAGARYQLAGYWLAHQLEHEEPLDERWSVQLTPEHVVPYRVTRYDDWRDFDVWRAIVTTYHAQAARRRAA
jgi:hypothetical protein